MSVCISLSEMERREGGWCGVSGPVMMAAWLPGLVCNLKLRPPPRLILSSQASSNTAGADATTGTRKESSRELERIVGKLGCWLIGMV